MRRSRFLLLLVLSWATVATAEAAPSRKPAAQLPPAAAQTATQTAADASAPNDKVDGRVSSAGLRGRLPALKPTALPKRATPVLLKSADIGLQTPTASLDPSQCRLACAHSYYFCLAGGETDHCAGGWMECLSPCDTPSERR